MAGAAKASAQAGTQRQVVSQCASKSMTEKCRSLPPTPSHHHHAHPRQRRTFLIPIFGADFTSSNSPPPPPPPLRRLRPWLRRAAAPSAGFFRSLFFTCSRLRRTTRSQRLFIRKCHSDIFCGDSLDKRSGAKEQSPAASPCGATRQSQERTELACGANYLQGRFILPRRELPAPGTKGGYFVFCVEVGT